MAITLPDNLHLGPVTLRVADAERSLDFYSNKVGLELLDRTPERIALGAGGEPVLFLEPRPGLGPRRSHETGLYHVAILVPDRAALGGVIARLAANDIRMGAADHLVSEAIYIWDPDNNGVEIYRDRPREAWSWNDGQVRMANSPLDFPGLLAEAGADALAKVPIKAGTRIGHVHFQVDDVDKARAFYADLIGFAPTAGRPGALFVSAGRYHHHLAFNTWESRNGPPPSPGSAGIVSFTIELDDRTAADALQARLTRANVAVAVNDGGFSFVDPWQTRVAVQLRNRER